jgi:hypothetical protein
LKPGLYFFDQLNLPGSAGQLNRSLSGGNGFIESTGGSIRDSQGVEISRGTIAGKLARALRQSHGANGVATLGWRESGEHPGQIVLRFGQIRVYP